MRLLREFKPALMFLGKFLLLYFVGNILYGIYIESHRQEPDAVTRLVTAQSSGLLNLIGYVTTYEGVKDAPRVALEQAGIGVLHVYEGCNGINVMIVFIAFLFAFGGPVKALSLFLFAGVMIIHLFNLLRIGLLFHLALENSSQFYYYHKYFFTATLYLVVFGLWTLWVLRFNEKRRVYTSES